MFNNQLFLNPMTQTLSDIYPTYEKFESDYSSIGLEKIPFKDQSFLRHIYLVLMAEYMSSPIASLSVDQFRLKLMNLVTSYGPEFERLIQVQQDLLSMDITELTKSAEAVYNSAFNPSKPLDTVDGRVLTVNQQNTTTHHRSKLDAYQYLMSLVNSDITRNFTSRFSKLFAVVLQTNYPLYYVTEEGSLDL